MTNAERTPDGHVLLERGCRHFIRLVGHLWTLFGSIVLARIWDVLIYTYTPFRIFKHIGTKITTQIYRWTSRPRSIKFGEAATHFKSLTICRSRDLDTRDERGPLEPVFIDGHLRKVIDESCGSCMLLLTKLWLYVHKFLRSIEQLSSWIDLPFYRLCSCMILLRSS